MFGKDRALDNPMNWSFKVGRLFRIDIRLHVFFILGAVIQLAMDRRAAGPDDPRSFFALATDALGISALLFLIVLLHEFGHCFGARRSGGDADEILLWPLGGLAFTRPPHNPAAHMLTTIAGPMVNVLICAIVSVVLMLWLGGVGAVPWNPLHPMTPLDATLVTTTAQAWLLRFYGLSYFLLLVNLLPIFPFDGGRVMQAWLWPRKGYESSLMIATSTGMIGAVAVGVFGIFSEQSWLLLMVAVFGYLECMRQRRQIKEGGGASGGEFGYDFSQGYTSLDRADEPKSTPGFLERRRVEKAARKAEKLSQEKAAQARAVEEILRKVSATGIASLTTSERRTLEKETERQRAGGQRDSDLTN